MLPLLVLRHQERTRHNLGMKRFKLKIRGSLWALACFLLTFLCVSAMAVSSDSLVYSFQFKGIDHNPVNLSDFQGKVILIVNTACLCGFTPQLAGLQQLHETYKDRGLIVIGVPSNDFGNQEPWTMNNISKFVHENYALTFLLTEKEHVKGEDAHLFYQWAASQVTIFGRPRWNFHKYLIDRKGNLINWFLPTTSPTSSSVINAIEKALGTQ